MSSSEISPLAGLLAKARAGDAQARDELFEKCRSYMCLVARTQVESWLRTKVDASDIVQQTMLEAHRGFDRFQGQTDGEWLGWLRRILAHNTTDFVRRYHCTEKRQVRREVPLVRPRADGLREFCLDPVDPGESPSQFVLRREREIEVADAIAQLPADYQEVILLRNLQRLPFDEVAERMGRSRPATQMLWMRAIRKLQDQLKTAP